MIRDVQNNLNDTIDLRDLNSLREWLKKILEKLLKLQEPIKR